LLERFTGRHCALMPRGVETLSFSPEFRDRNGTGEEFVLGFCGRLSIEKNVALLARVRTELIAKGITNFRFLIIGHGKEEGWLRQHLPNAEFTGVLRGKDLARAYANMDLFVFPSHTDTFGNVVLEALASGVPAVVTPDGGPKFIVCNGNTGFVTGDEHFAEMVAELVRDRARLEAMRLKAREYALGCSWDAVFDRVYRGYGAAFETEEQSRELPKEPEPA
jgi:phosphatidylinositol alpha 1,6-mannosyltransferase